MSTSGVYATNDVGHTSLFYLRARIANSVHQTIGSTPAIAAGVADKRWTIRDLIVLLEQAEDAMPRKRGPYKPRQPKVATTHVSE